jgi:hypothetical protein
MERSNARWLDRSRSNAAAPPNKSRAAKARYWLSATDGRGLAPADGFDETKISLLSDGMIEVSSGDDKYRLPAQIKGQNAPAAETENKVAG